MVAKPRIGIVRNPKSRRNRDRPPVDAGSLGGHVLLREPRTHEALRTVCAEFAAGGIDLLAIDGGDGTVRDALTAAAEGAFPVLPPIAFLASGKTNILAPSSGSWGTGEAALRRLAALDAAGLARLPRKRLATMRIDGDGQARLGFVFGAGAYTKAIALADQGPADRIHFGPARIAAGVARAVAALSRGEERDRWLGGTPMRVAVEGTGGPASGARFVFLATTLERFTLGLWPFWNGDGGRAIRWLDVDAPPARFALALAPVLRGRPKPWMAEAGYRSGAADRLVLHLEEDFVLDGEAYAPGPGGIVSVSTGPTAEFVAP